MTNNSRRHVDEHAFATDLIAANIAAYHAANSEQPPPLAPIHEWRLQVPNQHVLVIRQSATRTQEAIVDLENSPDLGDGEVVQREARNDVVVYTFARQVFHR